MNQESSIVGNAYMSFLQYDFPPCIPYQAPTLTTLWKVRPNMLSLNTGP